MTTTPLPDVGHNDTPHHVQMSYRLWNRPDMSWMP